MSANYRDLFPSKLSFVVFVAYILLFVNQGILVTASQGTHNDYDYNIVTVVLMTEVFKFIASVLLYCKDNPIQNLVSDSVASKKLLGLYLIPAFLYCLYNNLSFVNLSAFDPTTYYLLLQFRVVVTAILFQIIFQKTLSKRQWLSLVLLTCGCMLKQINFTTEDNTSTKAHSFHLNIYTVFIFIQVVCSCLAGVYNEYILKNDGTKTDIYVQNVFMYIDSILCNLIVLLIKGDISNVLTGDSLAKVFQLKVLLVMINNSAIGIVTSFFLKTLNSIVKVYASALELVLTAILSYIFFSIPIYLNTVLAIGVVMYAVFLYTQQPVSNLPKMIAPEKQDDEEKLMEVA